MSRNIPYEQVCVFGNMPGIVFYQTPEWRRLRYYALNSAKKRCQLCGSTAKDSQLEVDHIKSRFLFPELCLDIGNLQVLCAECHSAKTIDDFEGVKATLLDPMTTSLSDIFRLERRHLVLEIRPPRNGTEVEWLSQGARCISKSHRKAWRVFVKFCFRYKLTYQEVALLRLVDFARLPVNHSRYAKYTCAKEPTDYLFQIGGYPFPKFIDELLADDQRGARSFHA